MFSNLQVQQILLVAVMAGAISKQEMAAEQDGGEKPVYYRMKIQRNMDMEDFVGWITCLPRISGLSQGIIW